MSRRRSPKSSSTGSRTRSAAAVAARRAPRRRNLLEGLEQRLLLTTVITDTDPLTPTPPTQQFEYKDAKGTAVRVVVHGDVSAEFIFAQVAKGAVTATLTGSFVIPGQPGTGTEIPGRDL